MPTDLLEWARTRWPEAKLAQGTWLHIDVGPGLSLSIQPHSVHGWTVGVLSGAWSVATGMGAVTCTGPTPDAAVELIPDVLDALVRVLDADAKAAVARVAQVSTLADRARHLLRTPPTPTEG